MFIKKALFHIIIALLALPVTATGQGLVPCSGLDCQLCDLFTLVSNVVGFLLGTIVPLVATFIFVLGGIKFYTAMGDSNKINEAKKMLINVIVGLVIVYTAHLLVTTILTTVGYVERESWNRIDFCN